MNIMRIFDGSFGGATLFENQRFISPNALRRLQKNEEKSNYLARAKAAFDKSEKLKFNQLPQDPMADVFA